MNITLILADGLKIENLEVNGNCLLSETEIPDELLTDILLLTVTVGETTYENVTLARKWEDGGKYWLALRQKTADEVREEKMKSMVEYIAMMSDVEVEV